VPLARDLAAPCPHEPAAEQHPGSRLLSPLLSLLQVEPHLAVVVVTGAEAVVTEVPGHPSVELRKAVTDRHPLSDLSEHQGRHGGAEDPLADDPLDGRRISVYRPRRGESRYDLGPPELVASAANCGLDVLEALENFVPSLIVIMRCLTSPC
jgi:hypothetical protein